MNKLEDLKMAWKSTKYAIADLQNKLLEIEQQLIEMHKEKLVTEGVNRFDNLKITTRLNRTLSQAKVKKLYNQLDQEVCALLPFVAKYSLDKRAYDRLGQIDLDTKELVDSCLTVKEAKPAIDIAINV